MAEQNDNPLLPDENQLGQVDMAEVVSRSTVAEPPVEPVDELPTSDAGGAIEQARAQLPPSPPRFTSRREFVSSIQEYNRTVGRSGRIAQTRREFGLSDEQTLQYLSDQDEATKALAGVTEPLTIGERIVDVGLRGPVAGLFGFAASVGGMIEKPLGGTLRAVGVEFPEPDPDAEVPSAATQPGQVVQSITQFGIGFALTRGATGGTSAAASAGQGAVADFVSFDAHEERLSNLLTQFNNPILDNAVTRYLASDPSDSQIEGRLKNVLEGAVMGVGTELIFRGVRGIRNMRRARAAGDAAGAAKAVEREADQIEKALQRLDAQGQRGTTKGRQAMALKQMIDDEGKLGIVDILDKVNKGKVDLDEFLEGVHINYERIGSPDEAKAVIESVSKQIDGDIALKKGLSRSNDDVARMAEQLGADPREAVARVAAVGEMAPDFDVTVTTGRNMVANLSEQVALQAESLRVQGKSPEEIKRVLSPMIDALAAIHAEVATISTGFGRGLQAHKIMAGDGLAELADANVDNLIDALIMSKGDARKVVALLREPPTLGGRAAGILNHFWINSLLSGFRTHEINFITSLTLIPISNAEMAIGALARGDTKTMMIAARTFATTFYDIFDSIKWAGKSFYLNRPLGAPGSFIAEETSQLSSTFLGRGGDPTRAVFKGGEVAGSRAIGAAVDAVDVATGLPIRSLLAEDEFNKQLAARSLTRARLWQEAVDLGLSGKAASEHIVDGMRQAFDPSSGRILDEQALNHALDISFARNLEYSDGLIAGAGKSAQNLVNSHPAARQIIPFVRAPTNLMQHGFQRTPVLGFFSRQLRNDLKSADPMVRSKAMGKLVTGGTMAAGVAYMAYQGQITGRLSPNPDVRRQQQADGMKEYSFVVTGDDGKKEYIPYERVDPLAQVLRTLADVAQVADEIERQEGVAELDDIAVGVAQSIGRNMANNHWARSVTEMFDAATDDAPVFERFIRNRLASFVPAGLRDLNQDPNLRRVDSLLDAIYSRIPGLSPGMPALYNALGEPIMKPMGVGLDALNPFYAGKESDDPVDKELATLNQGFSLPPRTMAHPKFSDARIDLTEFVDSETGKDAFEAYNMLIHQPDPDEPTLREAIRELINDPDYQALPKLSDSPDDSLRIGMVQRVLEGYRNAARGVLLGRNKHIVDAMEAEAKRIASEQTGEQVQ